MRLRALAWLAFSIVVLSAAAAEAFCRSTTCTGDCPRDENGCKTTGLQLYWGGSCVSFSLQKDSSVHVPFKYFEQVIQRSFLAWTELECDTGPSTLAFSQTENVSCHQTEYNSSGGNANIILFQDYKWTYKGVDNTLAKTTVTFDDDTGEILDADIEINHANNNFTISDMVVEYDLESVLTHEVGHFIGIDHTPDFSATMYAGYEPGTIEQRTLEQDDVDAACSAYPPERQAACDPTPKGGLRTDCGRVIEDGGEEGGCSVAAAGSVRGGGAAPVLGVLFVAAVAVRRRGSA